MFSRFWSDSIWLASNVTWEDISNGPGKAVVYAEAKDFWALVPLVVLLLTIRFFCERHVYMPLGEYLDIKSPKLRKLTPNVILEAEYQTSFNCKNATALAKQLDLTERQVERWWRLRRQQEKPATLVKFCECMWKGCSYLFNVSVLMFTVWGQDWMWNPSKCFEHYPHQGITSGIWWSYMLSSAFYTSLFITQFRDVRRKDFWQMFFHHIVTVLLLFMSWTTQYFRVGCLVLLLHDSGDIVLEFGKAFKYAKFPKAVIDCLLAVFVVLWVGLRLVVFPFYVLPVAYSQSSKYPNPLTILLTCLLGFLLFLTLRWTWLIVQVAVKRVRDGEIASDIRSSGSEDSDEE